MKQILVSELKEGMTRDDLFLLDVREDYEHEAFDIGGKLIPLGEIIARVAEIPREQPVVVYCRKGFRSQIAIQRLEDKFGFTNLFNLQGGLEKWYD